MDRPVADAGWRRWGPSEGRGRQHFRYRSEALGDELAITVAVPPLAVDQPVPVVFALDPWLTFDTVVGWSRVYGRYAEGAVPPTLVVGVGHPTDEDARFMALRVRDLTPTPVTGRDWRPPLGAGQGPRMLSAIAHEIVPFIEQNFAVTTDRTIVGWSLGGLFTLYALFHEPKVFSRFLAVSPSLWWGNGLPLRWEEEWAAAHDDLDASVFLAVGANEEAAGGGWRSEGFSDEIIAWFRQVTNFRTFSERLAERRYPSLKLSSVIFPDEYHMTVYPAAVARGLVSLFGDHAARAAVAGRIPSGSLDE